MRIRALVPFSGILTMAPGEVREYNNEAVLQDLLRAGYIEEVSGDTPKKRTTKRVVSADGENQ